MSTQNRRQNTRWQINRQVKVKLEGAVALTSCAIKDINFKGMQIALGQKFKKDTFLKLTIFLAEEFILDIIEAWVVWQKTVEGVNVYGFYFSKIKDSDKEKIYQFIRRYFPERLTQQWWEGIEKGGEIMQEEKFQDRRVFERFSAKFPVRFLDVNSNKEGWAQTRDIGAKGIGLVTSAALAPRSSLEMWLEIPDKGEPLYTRGEAVWLKPQGASEYRVGINLEKADLMGLARVLRTI